MSDNYLSQNLQLHNLANTIPEYVGLLKQVVELIKVVKQEETELLSIEKSYELQRIELEGRIKQIEDFLVAELGSWSEMVKESHKHIAKLIEKNEFETAKFIFLLLSERFKERASQPLNLWNTHAGQRGIRLIKKD